MENQEIDVCKVANYVPIESLEFHPENPRTIRRERLDDLKRSITEKGFYEPILVWKDQNIVLAGNHRLRAAKELLEEGYTFKVPGKRKANQLPVVIEDCDAETAEAILFETNNHYAEWIDEKLRSALIDIKDRTDLRTYGFDEVELANLLSSAEEQAKEISDSLPDNADGKEFDETAADDVVYETCPECNYRWPK